MCAHLSISEPLDVGRVSVIRDCTMLVLSRKVGEKILIGDGISVTIVRVAQGIVRVGVEAPADTPIVREEIKNRLAKEPSHRQPAARS